MSVWRQITHGLRVLVRREDADAEIKDEVHDFYERAREDRISEGFSAEDAERAVRRDLGHEEHAREQLGAYGWERVAERLFSDLRIALRRIIRSPSFALTVVSTLAIGIGVNVAIFSLAEQVLLRPLPVPDPERLVILTNPGTKMVGRMDAVLPPQMQYSDSGRADTIFSYPMFRDLEREQDRFVGLAAHTTREASLSTAGGTELGTVIYVSGSYFPVLSVQPALGRLLDVEDDRVDGLAESVVLSHAYWRNELGGNRDVLGQTLAVNGVPLTIVGVAPEGFHGSAVSVRPSVFVPITIKFPTALPPMFAGAAVPNHDRRDSYWVHLLGRLRPGVSRDGAAATMNVLYRSILSDIEAPLLNDVNEQQREAFRTRTLGLESGARGQTSIEILSPARNGIQLLLAVSGLVLLLCCSNVAGLILLRATTRGGEMAVRASLGATRGRLVRLQITESLALALPAALLGLPVGLLTLRAASRVPSVSAAAPDASLSASAALTAIVIAVISALAIGLLPIIRGLARSEPVSALRTSGTRQTIGKGVARFRAALATSQVALSMALLAMMGVFAQSLANITRLDLGVDIDSVVMFSIPQLGLPTDNNSSALLAEALEAIPGVTSVASSLNPLLSTEGAQTMQASVEGGNAKTLTVSSNFVTRDFFQVFGVQLLSGRAFNDTDAEQAAIVSQRFAEGLGLTPEAIIGRRIRLGTVSSEIVGVIADVRSGSVTGEIEPQVFLSIRSGSTFYLRTSQPPESVLSAVRDTVAQFDPNLPITDLQTMEQQFRENIAIERLFAGTSTAFAVLATALAAIGLYGILAYSVAQRSREIALRFALGAPADRIRGMVLRQVTWMAVIGVTLGAAAAIVISRAAQSLLFDVEGGNPLVLVAAAAALTAVMLGAAYIPARRASRVDPMVALRYE